MRVRGSKGTHERDLCHKHLLACAQTYGRIDVVAYLIPRNVTLIEWNSCVHSSTILHSYLLIPLHACAHANSSPTVMMTLTIVRRHGDTSLMHACFGISSVLTERALIIEWPGMQGEHIGNFLHSPYFNWMPSNLTLPSV